MVSVLVPDGCPLALTCPAPSGCGGCFGFHFRAKGAKRSNASTLGPLLADVEEHFFFIGNKLVTSVYESVPWRPTVADVGFDGCAGSVLLGNRLPVTVPI